MNKKKTQRIPVSQLKQYMFRTFMFIFFVQVSQVGWLTRGLGCKGQWAKNFVSKAVDENGGGIDVYRVVQVESGGTSGMVTDDSETFRLGNFDHGRITLHSIVTQMIVTEAACG